MQISADAIPIEQAYTELTRQAFSVWIRFLVLSNDELDSGKKELAKIFGYTEEGFHVVLKELHCKDYLRWAMGPRRGTPTHVIIQKQALLSGNHNFLILNSRKFTPENTNQLHKISDDSMGGQESGIHTQSHMERSDIKKIEMKDTSNIGVSIDDAPKRVSRGTTLDDVGDLDEDGYIIDGNEEIRDLRNPSKLRSSMERQKCQLIPNKVDTKKEHKIKLNPSSSPSSLPPYPPPSIPISNPTSIIRLKANIIASPTGKQGEINSPVSKAKKTTLSEKMSAKASDNAKRKSEISKERTKKMQANKALPQSSIDFGQLDGNGNPMLSFDPKSNLRDKLIKVLDYNKRNGPEKMAAKKILKKKLRIEVTRIYSSYMSMKWKANHRTSKPPISKASCDKYAAAIGESCLRYGITPRQLLEYWDEHIINFADKQMKYPPLSLLASPMASERVAAVVFEATDGGAKKWQPGGFKKQKYVSHSFADTSLLHPELRQTLIDAGFEEGRTWTDRYLMSVQSAARSIANGNDIFVGGVMREMVKVAVHLYG